MIIPTHTTPDRPRSMARTIVRIANHPPGEGCASHEGAGRRAMNMLGRTYLVQYTDGRGQSQTERGSPVALDQDGFVVPEVNGKHLLIPKARIDALVEVE